VEHTGKDFMLSRILRGFESLKHVDDLLHRQSFFVHLAIQTVHFLLNIRGIACNGKSRFLIGSRHKTHQPRIYLKAGVSYLQTVIDVHGGE
jgi:hypothetical protein